jgi:hypothetical protein
MAVAAVMLVAIPAGADRVDELNQQLASSSEKTRMTAVVSLARIGDKRTLKPLVTALHDPSAQVRALAATALGHLGHKAALPSLRNMSNDDTDDTVRAKAREAALAVAKANHMSADLPSAQPAADPAPPVQARHNSGFGRSPHVVDNAPDLYVQIKTSSDDSPGTADKNTRKTHADIVKAALMDSFKTAPQVTMTQADAQRWGLDARLIDVSVVKMQVGQNGGYMEIETELRLAISDENGKMLSFLSGGAKVQVPRTKYNAKFLPDLRKEALESAMRGMFDKLVTHLRQTSQS